MVSAIWGLLWLQNNNLLEIGFDSLGSEFWKHNSPLANQLLLGAIGSVLAEVADNNSLNVDLMPFVVKIAKVTAVEPWLYVVPAALGACTNMILPIHLPMIVAHEVVDVPILQLVRHGPKPCIFFFFQYLSSVQVKGMVSKVGIALRQQMYPPGLTEI
nr:uncharacterized protein LOC129387690 isoform X1 [Dermacentor andersoni]